MTDRPASGEQLADQLDRLRAAYPEASASQLARLVHRRKADVLRALRRDGNRFPDVPRVGARSEPLPPGVEFYGP